MGSEIKELVKFVVIWLSLSLVISLVFYFGVRALGFDFPSDFAKWFFAGGSI